MNTTKPRIKNGLKRPSYVLASTISLSMQAFLAAPLFAEHIEQITGLTGNQVLSPQQRPAPRPGPAPATGQGDSGRGAPPAQPGPAEIDITLRDIIDNFGLDRRADTALLPEIEHPVPQLGMKLFFSKSLGGQFDSACVTCHHPALGGADRLSLSVGVDAIDPDLLGPGRQHQSGVPIVPRNAPTIFNTGLWDTGLFFDTRVESIGKEPGTNGMLSGIRTPDSAFFTPDENAGANLAAAQARFPVTSVEEMKSDNFEFGSGNEAIREHLAQRIGGYGAAADELPANSWLDEFQMAFGSTAPAEDLITFDNIAFALGEYERSMVFDNTPWSRYTAGDLNAINREAKQGARLFFTPVAQGGAGCGACHNGPLFSDGQHHNVAFPHIGPGKDDGNNDDFGRERETGDPVDRYRFRTPSLLNIATTAPYGHTGVYTSLQQVVRHYVNPQRSVQTLFDRGGACSLPQYRNVDDCELLYPENEANSILALQKLQQERQQGISRFQSPRLDNQQVDQLVAFLESLTDDCVQDRACLSRWIADPESSGPDGNQLNAHDPRGNTL